MNESNFDKEVIRASGEKMVIVDFWASWCMPCRMLAPAIEKIAEELKDKVIVAKLNVDENKALAAKYDIMSIPNVKLFKDGKVIDEFVGVKSEKEIKEWLEKK